MMRRLLIIGLLTLIFCGSASAVEILRWDRIPLALPLIVTSRFACSEAEAAVAWDIGRPHPESAIKPVKASRRVRVVRRSVWITAGL